MNSDEIRKMAQDAAEKAKAFNRKPPMWFYVAIVIVIVLAAQLLRFA